MLTCTVAFRSSVSSVVEPAAVSSHPTRTRSPHAPAAAVVAGNAAHLDVETLNTAAAVYLGSRVIFNYLYIHGTNSE